MSTATATFVETFKARSWRYFDTQLLLYVLLLIAVATLWNGLELAGLVLLLGLTGWFGVSRLVRTLVLSAREDEFVTAAVSNQG